MSNWKRAVALVLVLFPAPAAAQTSFGEVAISLEAEPQGMTVHGYSEYRFSIVNRSTDRAHRVGLSLPALVVHDAVGVVAAIAPWNYPQALLIMKIAPALVAGCTVVAKPSPETAIDGLVLAEIFDEAGLPPDVLAEANELIKIPHSEKVESLNAGVAASILLYEAARQRRG